MNSNQNILVKLKQTSFSINNKWLVKDVSLQIEKGKIVIFIGPNGSGKSTTTRSTLESIKKLMEKLKNTQIKLAMFLKNFNRLDITTQGKRFYGTY